VGAEGSDSSEKNQLHGGVWRPEGAPGFIPLSNNVAVSDLQQQPTQRIAQRLDEEYW